MAIRLATDSPISELIVYSCNMRAEAFGFTDKMSAFVTHVWMQIRAGVALGLPDVDGPCSGTRPDEEGGFTPTRRAIRSSGNYSGRLTRNGLGSLDIGGGRSGLNE